MVTLYDHQKQALKATEDRCKVAYCLGMGLGKTFCTSEKMISLGTSLTVVVCPKGLIPIWVKHFKGNYFYLDARKYSNEISDCRKKPMIIIISYDLLWRRYETLKPKDNTLVLGKSSYINHENGKRTKLIIKMAPNNIIPLSARKVIDEKIICTIGEKGEHALQMLKGYV